MEQNTWANLQIDDRLAILSYMKNSNRQGGCTRLDRIMRHMYGIERMMDKPFAKKAIDDADLYTEIVRHRSIMTAWHGMDYTTHHPSTIKFIPPESIVPELKADYKKMQENFIYGPSLDFDKLIGRLVELQERFRKEKWQTEFFLSQSNIL